MEGQANITGHAGYDLGLVEGPRQVMRQPEAAQLVVPMASEANIEAEFAQAMSKIGEIKVRGVQAFQSEKQKNQELIAVNARQATEIQRLNAEVGRLNAQNQTLVLQNDFVQKLVLRNRELQQENDRAKTVLEEFKLQIAALEEERKTLHSKLTSIANLSNIAPLNQNYKTLIPKWRKQNVRQSAKTATPARSFPQATNPPSTSSIQLHGTVNAPLLSTSSIPQSANSSMLTNSLQQLPNQPISSTYSLPQLINPLITSTFQLHANPPLLSTSSIPQSTNSSMFTNSLQQLPYQPTSSTSSLPQSATIQLHANPPK